jgi:hypothetical protein
MTIVATGGGDNDENGVFVTSLYVLDTTGEQTSEFSSGEEIQFELNIINTSSSRQTLEFVSGQQYDFFVRQAGTSDIIWLWSHDKAFAAYMSTLTFDPGETKSFTELWDQMDNDQVLVDPGLYEAQGVIVRGREDPGEAPSSSEFCSSWVAFEIL